MILAHFGTYENDLRNGTLENLSRQPILADYLEFQKSAERIVARTKREGAESVLRLIQKGHDVDPAEKETIKREVGEWFADYIVDNGYAIQISPQLIKHMIRTAFPPISKGGLEQCTPETLEKTVLRAMRVLAQFEMIAKLQDEDESGNFSGLMTLQGNSVRTAPLGVRTKRREN